MPTNSFTLTLCLLTLSPIFYLAVRIAYIRLLEEIDKKKLFKEVLEDTYRNNYKIETTSDPVKTLKFSCFCNSRLKTKDRLRDELQRTSARLLITSLAAFLLMIGAQTKVDVVPESNQTKTVSQ